ncbi:hypothetical protein KDX08_30225 [Burkholderia cenocepacia]|uniref:hypothetical protein n=1 Tax=Burkholderia cepacia complex TaxID=87882 RepID=UPI001ABAD573|nr:MULTISPECIES: hypothetical protein [Burkholderia cepacia complex]MBR7996732.1 hypothetical protein [Burkholderia cenocepacia]
MQATRLLVQIPSLDHSLVKGRTGNGAVDVPVETMVYAVKRIAHSGERLPDVVRVLAWIPESMRAYLCDRSRMVDMEHAWVTANVKDNRATLTPFMESGEYELSAPNAPSPRRKACRPIGGGGMSNEIDKARMALSVAVHRHARSAEFANYIETELAGDFAVVLAEMLAARPATGRSAGIEVSGYCEAAGGCVCGGDLPRVREGCGNWIRGKVE